MSLECLFDTTTDAPTTADALYTKIDFPDPPEDRPYLYLNMVSTADGKIVIGDIGGTAAGVGGPTDQLLFRRLQYTCDAAFLGASTLRASHVLYPPEKPRYVVTRNGEVPLQNRFFTDAPGKAWVVAPKNLPEQKASAIRTAANLLQTGQDGVDLPDVMRTLRKEHGIHHLLCEGGASLNDELIRAGLVDELFLTITNKLKGGSHLPTPVDGSGFSPGHYLPLTLLSVYRDGGELYLRYRLASAPVSV